jgi:hypothetical protein
MLFFLISLAQTLCTEIILFTIKKLYMHSINDKKKT